MKRPLRSIGALSICAFVTIGLCASVTADEAAGRYLREFQEIQSAWLHAPAGSAVARTQRLRLEKLIERMQGVDALPTLVRAYSLLADVYLLEKDLEESALALDRRVSATIRMHGKSDRRTLQAMAAAGYRWLNAGNLQRSEAYWIDYLIEADRTDAYDKRRIVATGNLGLARVLAASKRYEEADEHYIKASEMAEGNLFTWEVLKGRAEVLDALGRTDEAGVVRARAEEARRAAGPPLEVRDGKAIMGEWKLKGPK